MKINNNHSFTKNILDILQKHFPNNFKEIFECSELLQYLNIKTKSANKGSKARGAFANHYALYVLIEDYLKNGFDKNNKDYSKYEGANFNDLFIRQRELPFGKKLQNHALNSRLNEEFKKFFPSIKGQPIVRDVVKRKYWINDSLLKISFSERKEIYNISQAIIDIIDNYVETKKESFDLFISDCLKIKNLSKSETDQAYIFIKDQLAINVDARIFEIVSFSILKVKYQLEYIYIGKTKDTIEKESLILFKTGRTNANDGGIDFVMKPLGRFFQVTETTDFGKYFLDIEKVLRYPITFVIKSEDSHDEILRHIKEEAIQKYKIQSIVDDYIKAIEDIITVKDLLSFLDYLIKQDCLDLIIENIVLQSKIEFNYDDVDDPLDFVEYTEDIKEALDN